MSTVEPLGDVRREAFDLDLAGHEIDEPAFGLDAEASPMTSIGTTTRMALSMAIWIRSAWRISSVVGSIWTVLDHDVLLLPGETDLEEGVLSALRLQDLDDVLFVQDRDTLSTPSP